MAEGDLDRETAALINVDAPKVALMFLSLGEIHNEPAWRAFFEAAGTPLLQYGLQFSCAGRLKFRFELPNRPFRSYVNGDGKAFFDQVNKVQTANLFPSNPDL